jgi:hypothetical protein
MPTDHYRLFLGEGMKGRARDVYRLQNFCFLGSSAERLHKAGVKVSHFFTQVREGFPQPDKFERIMASHLLPADATSGLWQDDFDSFCRQRAAIVLARIHQLAGMSQGISEEDPVINAIEIGLRDNIHHALAAKYGADYWETAIPESIRKSIAREINGDARRNASSGDVKDPRHMLDFASPKDYWTIVEANAACFSPTLTERGEQNFKDFQDYRNTTKHNRRADTYLSTRGLAACIYLSRALKLDLSKYGVF